MAAIILSAFAVALVAALGFYVFALLKRPFHAIHFVAVNWGTSHGLGGSLRAVQLLAIAVAIAFLAALYLGFRELFQFFPATWGSADEYGEWTSLREAMSALSTGLIGLTLLYQVPRLAMERVFLLITFEQSEMRSELARSSSSRSTLASCKGRIDEFAQSGGPRFSNRRNGDFYPYWWFVDEFRFMYRGLQREAEALISRLPTNAP